MNVQDPKKRFESPRGNRNDTSISQVPTLPVGNAIPKEHVGAGQNNQLQFNRTNDRTSFSISEKNSFNINTNQNSFITSGWQLDAYDETFDLAGDDLFDILYPEPTPLLKNVPETQGSANESHQGIPVPMPIPKRTISNYKKRKLRNGFCGGIVYRPEIEAQQINNHPLAPLVDEWADQTNGTERTRMSRISLLNRFLRFLVANNVDYPVSTHISKYIEEVNNNPLLGSDQNVYIFAVGRFFRWAAKNNKYRDIVGNLITDLDSNDTTTNNENTSINELTVETAKLTSALNTWIKTLDNNPVTRTKYRTEITNLILYLSQKCVVNATQKDISAYYQTGKFCNISIIESFFSWIEKQGIGRNLTLNIQSIITPAQMISIEKRKKDLENQKELAPKQNQIISLDDMEKAGFAYNEWESLLNNELNVFKTWINTLVDSPNFVDFKRRILEFAHFLLKEVESTTPTQDTIVEFYNKYLSEKCISTINKHLIPIKRFFEWTNKNTIYPNIAINCCLVYKGSHKRRDIPILCESEKMQFIPPALSPLIIISHI